MKKLLQMILAFVLISAILIYPVKGAMPVNTPINELTYEKVEIENNDGELDYNAMSNQIYHPDDSPVPDDGDRVRTFVTHAQYTPDGKLYILWGLVNYSGYDRTIFDVYNVYLYYYNNKHQIVPIAKTDRRFASGISSPFVSFNGEVIDNVASMVFNKEEFDHTVKLSDLKNLHLRATWKTKLDNEFDSYHFSVNKMRDTYKKDVILKSTLKSDYTKISVKKIKYDFRGMKVTLQIDNESDQTIRWKQCVELYLRCDNLGKVLAKGKNVPFDNPCEIRPQESKEVSLTLKNGQFDPNIEVGEKDYIRFDGVME